MKSILVPTGGSATDQVVFETALAVAKPLGAHLVFLHIRMQAGQAAPHTPHVAFARGAALTNALDELTKQGETRATAAKENVLTFCRASQIELRDQPCATTAVTAQWRMEEGEPLQRLVFHARHSDLTVMGRAKKLDGLPPDRLESVLTESGRPLLIAASDAPTPLLHTVMVCWKETAHAARAVSAALPVLTHAGRVVVASVTETGNLVDAGVSAVVHALQWHGINVGSRVSPLGGLSTPDRLSRIARECGASLIVMGGYGHSPMRELLFGGCTQAALEGSDLPVFLLH